MDGSESARWFADIDEDMGVESRVGDVDRPVLEAVEAVELEPTRSRVQQLRPANTRHNYN